jgi:hypothetical protein
MRIIVAGLGLTITRKVAEAKARQALLSRFLSEFEIATRPASNFAWLRLPEVWTSFGQSDSAMDTSLLLD